MHSLRFQPYKIRQEAKARSIFKKILLTQSASSPEIETARQELLDQLYTQRKERDGINHLLSTREILADDTKSQELEIRLEALLRSIKKDQGRLDLLEEDYENAIARENKAFLKKLKKLAIRLRQSAVNEIKEISKLEEQIVKKKAQANLKITVFDQIRALVKGKGEEWNMPPIMRDFVAEPGQYGLLDHMHRRLDGNASGWSVKEVTRTDEMIAELEQQNLLPEIPEPHWHPLSEEEMDVIKNHWCTRPQKADQEIKAQNDERRRVAMETDFPGLHRGLYKLVRRDEVTALPEQEAA